MLKPIAGILAIAVLTTACGNSSAPELSAAEPAAGAATPASQRPLSPEQSRMASPTNRTGLDSAARPASRRSEAAPTRDGAARAERAGTAPATTAPVPAYREFTLPIGTTLSLELKSALSSDISEVEDTVRATLRKAVTVEGQEVLPAGTELAGHVTEAERSGRVRGRARLGFRFTSLRHDDERMSLRTDPVVHEAEATKSEDATKIGIGAGAGAVIGAVVGGKSGAAKGAAIGGGAGTGAVLATRGKEVRLSPGTRLSVRLTEAVTIRVRK